MPTCTCAVIGCTNNTHRIRAWKRQHCEKHGCNYGMGRCICDPPFQLYTFPSKEKCPDTWTSWINCINQNDTSRQTWTPNLYSRVCSDHFVDSKPTEANPNPTLNLSQSTVLRNNSKIKDLLTAPEVLHGDLRGFTGNIYVPKSNTADTLIVPTTYTLDTQAITLEPKDPILQTDAGDDVHNTAATQVVLDRNSGLFQCNYCGDLYTDQQAMEDHVRIHAGDDFIIVKEDVTKVSQNLDVPKCDDESRCDDRVENTSWDNMVRRMVTHKDEYRYPALNSGVVDEGTVQEEGFQLSFPTQHDSKCRWNCVPELKNEFRCEECGQTFEKKIYLEIHRKAHESEVMHPCIKCPKICQDDYALDYHWTTEHAGCVQEIVKCEHCGMVFNDRLLCEKHERDHTCTCQGKTEPQVYSNGKINPEIYFNADTSFKMPAGLQFASPKVDSVQDVTSAPMQITSPLLALLQKGNEDVNTKRDTKLVGDANVPFFAIDGLHGNKGVDSNKHPSTKPMLLDGMSPMLMSDWLKGNEERKADEYVAKPTGISSINSVTPLTLDWLQVRDMDAENKCGEIFCCSKCPKIFKDEDGLSAHASRCLKKRCRKCGDYFTRSDLKHHLKCCDSKDLDDVTIKKAKETLIEDRKLVFLPEMEGYSQTNSLVSEEWLSQMMAFVKYQTSTTRKKIAKDEENDALNEVKDANRQKTQHTSQCSWNVLPVDKNISRCHKCGQTFKRKIYLEIHMKSHKTAGVHPCIKCPQIFKAELALDYHWEAEHGGCVREVVKCQHCGLAFNDQALCEEHEGRHVCTCKNKHSDWKYDIEVEKTLRPLLKSRQSPDRKRNQSPDGTKTSPVWRFRCDVCGDMFKELGRLETHMQQHSSFPCTQCPKLFTNKISLKIHCKSCHVKTVQCKCCGQTLPQSHNRRKSACISCESNSFRFTKKRAKQRNTDDRPRQRNEFSMNNEKIIFLSGDVYIELDKLTEVIGDESNEEIFRTRFMLP